MRNSQKSESREAKQYEVPRKGKRGACKRFRKVSFTNWKRDHSLKGYM